jgi:hypothetical protein
MYTNWLIQCFQLHNCTLTVFKKSPLCTVVFKIYKKLYLCAYFSLKPRIFFEYWDSKDFHYFHFFSMCSSFVQNKKKSQENSASNLLNKISSKRSIACSIAVVGSTKNQAGKAKKKDLLFLHSLFLVVLNKCLN